jgi:Flp pilus assembly protein TadG
VSRLTVFTAYRRGRRERGQSLVEFAVLVPLFMLILIGMLEFGLMFNHDLTLQYASREGARVGAALGCGATSNTACDTIPASTSCPSNPTNDVDAYIVAAVQRVLEASGSPINMTQVGSIKIFQADASGNQVGTNLDTWTYSAGGGPSVDCKVLDFKRQGSNGWADTTRVTSATSTSNCGSGLSTCPDSIGIKIAYQYQYVTPLAAVMRFFGGPAASTQSLNDQTVMALNPTS